MSLTSHQMQNVNSWEISYTTGHDLVCMNRIQKVTFKLPITLLYWIKELNNNSSNNVSIPLTTTTFDIKQKERSRQSKTDVELFTCTKKSETTTKILRRKWKCYSNVAASRKKLLTDTIHIHTAAIANYQHAHK